MKPEIRCGQHISNWNYYKIGELCELLTGFPFPGCQIVKTGKNLLMRGINITEGYIRHSEDIDRYYDGHTTNLEKYRLKTGDLVIGMDGSKVGKNSALITSKENNSLLVQRVARLRNKDRNLIRLIQITVSSSKFLKYIEEMKTSSAIPHISPTDIKDFTISLPTDLNERNLLASYFQSLDSLIQTTSKELASLKQIKAASLQSMFPQEGETVPKVRFKGFKGEWDKVKLSTLGQTYSGLTGKTKEDFNFGDSLYIPFLNVLLNPQIDESNLQKVRVENNEKQNEIHKGDILFNTSSETPEEVGLCSVFMSDIKKVYLNSFCFGFRLFNNLVDPSYIVYLLRSQIGRKLMLVLAQGATRYNLSKKSFLNAHIIIPTSQQEQQKIASYFCNLDKQLSLQAQRLEKLKQIKAACLDKMFV